VFDEIFFNNKAPNFERNRVSAALGYQFDKKWILQAGWLNQRNYTATTSSAKNNMLLTLMYRINRKNSRTRAPANYKRLILGDIPAGVFNIPCDVKSSDMLTNH
jgi:ABC-type oligopeptide transport system substrate-binding subunit